MTKSSAASTQMRHTRLARVSDARHRHTPSAAYQQTQQPSDFRTDPIIKLDESSLNGSNTRPFAAAFSAPARKHKGRVAQLVEQGIENPRVGGSIPSSATIPANDSEIAVRRCEPFRP